MASSRPSDATSAPSWRGSHTTMNTAATTASTTTNDNNNNNDNNTTDDNDNTNIINNMINTTTTTTATNTNNNNNTTTNDNSNNSNNIIIERLFPCLFRCPTVLAAGLCNANPVIHPSITLLNLGYMENQVLLLLLLIIIIIIVISSSSSNTHNNNIKINATTNIQNAHTLHSSVNSNRGRRCASTATAPRPWCPG